MIESETQDQQEEMMGAFYTKVKKILHIDLPIGNKLHAKNLITVWLQVDMGASTNLMSMEVFQKLFPGQNLTLAPKMFFKYGNTTITAEGECTVYIHYQGRKHQCKFYVTSCNDSPTLLSCESSTAVGLVESLF